MKKNYYETTETPQVDMHSVWVSLAIGVIAFIAAMFISNKAQAQPDSAAIDLPESTLKSGNAIRFALTPYSTRITPQQKKDTVEVQAACIEFIHVEAWEPSEASPVKWLQILEVKTLVQERTLEWQTVSLPIPSRNGMIPAINATETKWVTIETRWLSPIDGCYQLTPLTDD